MAHERPYVLLTASLPISIAILLLYGFFGCCLWSRVIIKRPVLGFALLPWWSLLAVRVLQAVFGIVSSVSSDQRSDGYLELLYTYLWDVGLVIITFALLRTAALLFKVKPLSKSDIFQYIWIIVAIGLETIGTAFAGIERFGGKSGTKYGLVSSGILQASICIVIATLVGLAVTFVYAIVIRQRSRSTSIADFTIAVVSIPIIALLGVRLGPDANRLLMFHSPSLAFFIAAGLVTEILCTAIWIALAAVITRWQHLRRQELLGTRADKKAEWGRHMDDAISYAEAVRAKGADTSHRKKPWILWVVETRFWNEEKRSSFIKSAAGREGAVQMLQRLKVVALTIADNLELDEDPDQPLFKKPSRAINMKVTERKVAEALVAQSGMTEERAAKVAREWVIIFVMDWNTLQPLSAS